jgi:hypothetical protein
VFHNIFGGDNEQKSSSGGFNIWGTAGIVALLVVGGFFARNYFINVNGSNNQIAEGGIRNTTTNNTTIYGNPGTLLVIPSESPTVTSPSKPVEANAPASEFSLQVLEPPVIANPSAGVSPDGKYIVKNVVRVAPGQEYKLDFVVNYRSKSPTKFYANLKPDVDNSEMYRKAHLDNVSAIGRPLEGDGTLRFSLRGIAPREIGSHDREITMGLMDYKNWGPIVHYQFPFILVVK